MSDPAPRRHGLLKAAWVIVISMALAGSSLFGLEAYLARQPSDLRIVDPAPMAPVWHHRPNLDLVLTPPRGVAGADTTAPNGRVRFRTDRRGFIAPAADRGSSDVVIAFLGGSSTENYWVEEASRFAALSTKLLSKRTGRRIGAWNAGYPGANAMDSVAKLRHLIAPMRPDIAVLMHGINDAGMLLRYGGYPREGEPREARARPSRDWATDTKAVLRRALPHSMVWFNEIAGAARRVLFGDPAGPEQWLDDDAQSTLSNPEILSKLVPGFKHQLGLFIEICRKNGIQPVLMTQAHRLASSDEPFTFPPGPLGWSPRYTRVIDALHAALQDTVRATARVEDIPLIDLQKLIPGQRALLWDQVHMTKAGARKAAALIAARLAPVIAGHHKF